MDARRIARRYVLYTGGVIIACLGTGFFLTRNKPSAAWLLPFAIGCALLVYGLGSLFRAHSARKWRVVRGTVVSSELGEVVIPGKGGGYIRNYPLVCTQYDAGSGPLITDRYSLVPEDFRGWEEATRVLLAAYPPGAEVDVYVNPEDPQEACLRPVPSPTLRSQYFAAVVGGSLVVAIALSVYAHL